MRVASRCLFAPYARAFCNSECVCVFNRGEAKRPCESAGDVINQWYHMNPSACPTDNALLGREL